jgi:hypothetical protein
MDLRDERELALQRLRILCHSGLFSILDFRSASCLHACLASVFWSSRCSISSAVPAGTTP